jgi:S-adenosylmethionine-diacylglycerol 3-amino-3-carboxypropyl transferase
MIPFIGVERQSRKKLADAVHHSDPLSREGMLERLFTFLFSKLVYPQIWEDPVVDMDALCLRRGDRLITIASGGCNVASYLVAEPERIIAVDLNDAHIALNHLKITALRTLPDYGTFRRFFGNAAAPGNAAAYHTYIAPHLDQQSRSYWEKRDLFGRETVSRFERGFYRYGLLGNFIGIVHLLARLHGRNASAILQARTVNEQKEVFERDFAPMFRSWFIRMLVNQPASLYGLGIPPAQYRALAGDHPEGMIGALRERVRKLACDFPLADNYFAHQAFGRCYSQQNAAALPPYLQSGNFERIRTLTDRVAIKHVSMTNQLAMMPAQSLDCYVLLDAQDWMNDEDLNALWTQITRTACPGARVIFRTAANEPLLPGRVSENMLNQWQRNDIRSRALHARDRSAIYGAFHLYQRKESRFV